MNHFWPLIQKAVSRPLEAIQDDYSRKFQELAAAERASPRDIAHFVYILENFNSDDLTVESYRRRSPYDHPDVVQADYEQFKENGWLESIGDGRFRLTDDGRRIRQARWEMGNPLLTRVEFLPAADLDYLLTLMRKLSQVTAAAPELPARHNFSIRQSYGLKQPNNSCAWWRIIFGYRMDLLAYRDDAHLAAWQGQYSVSAHTWEVFNQLWAGYANTLVQVAQNLAHRGYSQADTIASLDDLTALGWIEETGGSGQYCLTTTGRTTRQGVENQTDRLFFTPWSTLSTQEIADLERLLNAVETGT